MQPDMMRYFASLSVRGELRPRVEACLEAFEIITGAPSEQALLISAKDLLGNDAWEMFLFSQASMMNCGRLLVSMPVDKSFEVEALTKRVAGFKLSGRHFDPVAPGAPHDVRLAELRCELHLVGRVAPKPIEFVVYGANCTQLHRCAVEFFGGNLVS